ncbi:SprB repeat-containing protein, partial [Kriegella aquimaris]
MANIFTFPGYAKNKGSLRIVVSKGIFIIFLFFLGSYSAFSQVKNDFDVRYEADIRGELTFIANSIVGPQIDAYCTGRRRNRVCYPEQTPNDPYNLTGRNSGYNDDLNMQYIDVDGDTSTFSSSSAALDIPDIDCALVRYAGLYWSAVYVNSDRSNIDEIKFKVPGGVYQDITADEILFDGNGDADFGYYSPYAMYADVTSIVSGMANPNGDYFVANVRASSGSSISGGISGGWSMVVVYENPNLSGSKYITTFDGYAGIKSGEEVNIPVNGFTTLPAPFPVIANMGVAALEGDNRIDGDGLEIDANGVDTPILSNTENPANNFFNSSITIKDAPFTARNPNSINTSGWDVDLIEIPNTNNRTIPNDATSANLRAFSSGDKYDIFFASFDVEIIAPNIILEKRVNTPGGDDITGEGVHLGQVLDYVLTFDNIGNDDAKDYTIRDVLPVNVSPPDGRSFFNASDFDFPDTTPLTPIEYVYNPATREVVFTIPDHLVQDEDPAYSIRMRVQVAENCYDFINACSDLIENLAFSTYRGDKNSAMITDDPSVTDFNACGFTVPGATNFLLDDLSDCNFYRTVELCGTSALLNAGDGFDSYVWYRDTNGNNEIDAVDTVINDGDPDNDPSTITVSTIGTYIVDKIVADPCKGFKEIIEVQPFGSGSIPHPIIEFLNEVNNDSDPSNDVAGEIVSCSIDSDLLPKIFLCGINDSHLLQVNILDAQNVIWEKLDEGSCTASGDDCANKALTCTWNQVGTGSNYLLNSEGQFRLSVTYQNGCTSRFYFNGFQNTLDIQYNERDIICNTPGNVTITNIGNGYGFQLIDDLTNNVLIPFSANNGPSFDFASGENGSYRVEVTQLDTNGDPIVNACIFSTPVIGILDRDVTYAVNVTSASCIALGTINIQINNADPVYEYEIRLDDGSNGGLGTLIDSETAQPDNNFTFTDLSPGDYIAVVRSEDGCSYTENVTILNENDLWLSARVSQHITCREGNILMDSGGGKTPHNYAIWSYVDEGGTTVTSYPTPQDIPAANFQTSQIFDIYDPGDYTFVVVDRNNCFSYSNTVSIEFRPAAEFNATSVVDVSCFGDISGSIQFDLVDDNGYQLTYFLYDSNDVEVATNGSGNFQGLPADDYTVIINQSKGSASCDYEESYTISSPTNPINGSASLIQDYTCLQDAIIEAQNITGGTAPFEFSIDGINFVPDTTPNAHRFANLSDGTYSITIRDDAGCTFVTNPITVDPLNEPSDLVFSATSPNCPALTSDVTVTVTDGNPNFTYEIIAPAADAVNNGNSNVFTALEPGTYTFQITDTKGCTVQEDFTVTPVNRINALGQLDGNVTCFGLSDGVISFNITDFSTSYDYTVSGPSNFSGTAQTANILPLSGLSAGTYTITVTDNDTNCSDTDSVEVQGPVAALTLSVNVTQPSCITDGSVTLTASDGWGGYTYELTNPDTTPFGTNANGSFSGLTQTGTYNASVTDANGCVVTTSFSVDSAVAPILAITPNGVCYDDANGLTLTANVTSGGDGNFEYNLNGGAFASSNVFSGLNAGTYTINVRDGKNCTDSETITINPELSVTASASPISACGSTTEVNVTAAGGDGNFVYAVVNNGIVPSAGSFTSSNAITVNNVGDYDVYVRDNNGNIGFCETNYDITIVKEDPLSIVITNTPVLCSSDASASLTITPSGGGYPYQYSIDNGATYQTSNTFLNLAAGSYNIQVRDSNNCTVSEIYAISEPFNLSASALVAELIECNPSGAEVRIVNARGGTTPYSYSFDGGATYNPSNISYLLPGTHDLFIRDANNCYHQMEVTVSPPFTPPGVTTTIDYACDGEGTITVTPDDPSYNYTYEIDAVPNTPATSNVFDNISPGNHVVTVNYVITVATPPSTLLFEDFGFGTNTGITQIDPAYCYEPQDGSASLCGFGTNTELQDGEYTVTQGLINTYPAWLSPNDHTGNTNGRFLAINVGGVAGVGGIIYAKRDVEVLPDQDITISLSAFNLLRNGTSGGDPSIEIQLVDGSGNVIASTTTGNVPKNFGANDWHDYSVLLNPGPNTSLDIVIRTNSAVEDGNDIAIDDILATQPPAKCPSFVNVDVLVEDGNAIEASVISYEDLDCNGDGSGSITFEVENFGPGGFEYSLDDFATTLGGGTTSPQTISGLPAGNYTVTVRDLDDPTAGCTVTLLEQTIAEPPVMVASANISEPFTCNNTGATITAGATGGTPNYS